jgi:excisionase family DNA binding protein
VIAQVSAGLIKQRANPVSDAEVVFLSIKQAARLLNVSPRSIYRRVWNGTLPYVRVGKSIRIHTDALREMVTTG